MNGLGGSFITTSFTHSYNDTAALEILKPFLWLLVV